MGDQVMEKIFEYLRTLKQKQSEIQDESSKLESKNIYYDNRNILTILLNKIIDS